MSKTHFFSFSTAPNKKGVELEERGWVMDTCEFCLRTHLWQNNQVVNHAFKNGFLPRIHLIPLR